MTYPPIPLAEWSGTKDTLHRWLQVVGKLRLAHAPVRNHWWHVPLHLTGQGLTTRPMGAGDTVFTVDLDLVAHRVVVSTLEGRVASHSLPGLTVAQFYHQLLHTLAAAGVPARVDRPVPYDLPDTVAFAEDTRPATYDPAHATRYWQVLSRVGLLLEEFAGRSYAKTSPVHHFWHTLDIATTRFSGRRVDQPPGADLVTREAYSHEVVSSGFWFGDEQVPEPCFYSYTAPEPPGLAEQPLRPATATWQPSRGAHLALLRYEDVRRAEDPRGTVLDFYESAYAAGARLAGWDVEALRCPHAPPPG